MDSEFLEGLKRPLLAETMVQDYRFCQEDLMKASYLKPGISANKNLQFNEYLHLEQVNVGNFLAMKNIVHVATCISS